MDMMDFVAAMPLFAINTLLNDASAALRGDVLGQSVLLRLGRHRRGIRDGRPELREPVSYALLRRLDQSFVLRRARRQRAVNACAVASKAKATLERAIFTRCCCAATYTPRTAARRVPCKPNDS